MTMNDLRKLCRKLQVEQHETIRNKKEERKTKKERDIFLHLLI